MPSKPTTPIISSKTPKRAKKIETVCQKCGVKQKFSINRDLMSRFCGPCLYIIWEEEEAYMD